MPLLAFGVTRSLTFRAIVNCERPSVGTHCVNLCVTATPRRHGYLRMRVLYRLAARPRHGSRVLFLRQGASRADGHLSHPLRSAVSRCRSLRMRLSRALSPRRLVFGRAAPGVRLVKLKTLMKHGPPHYWGSRWSLAVFGRSTQADVPARHWCLLGGLLSPEPGVDELILLLLRTLGYPVEGRLSAAES